MYMHVIMFIIKFQIFSKKISFYKLIILILIPFKKLFMHRAKFVNFWDTSRHIRSKFLTIIRHIIFSFYSQITFTHVIQIRLFSFISREEISILSVTTLRYLGTIFSKFYREQHDSLRSQTRHRLLLPHFDANRYKWNDTVMNSVSFSPHSI